MAQNISCPVNGKQVDENVVRLVAAHVVLLTILSIWFSNYWIAAFLFIDFLTRAIGFPKFSLLRWSSFEILDLLDVPVKLTDYGAKQFAARIGTVVTALLFLALFYHILFPALLISGMLSVFATLEAGFGLCIGCYAYNLLPGN